MFRREINFLYKRRVVYGERILSKVFEISFDELEYSFCKRGLFDAI